MTKPLADKHLDVRLLLLAGLYSVAELHRPAHASVNAAVSAAAALGKPWAKGLVNGVLRNALRGGEALANYSIEGQRNHPKWLIDLFQSAWPDYDLCAANNERAPMVLRVNRLKTTREAALTMLRQAGLEASGGSLSADAVVLAKPVAVKDLPGFAEGLFSVQDEAGQLAAGLLNLAPGQRVLDACAAPGGKACHLLETCPDILLTAMDKDARRLSLVQENLDRLGLSCTTRCAALAEDGQALEGEQKQEQEAAGFDRILLDAPCSATGVIRRHPDIKLLRQRADIDKLSATQNKLLAKAFDMLNPGGELVYATCSVLPCENDEVVKGLLGKDSSAHPLPINSDHPACFATEAGMQLLPGGSVDGFFYARLGKAL